MAFLGCKSAGGRWTAGAWAASGRVSVTRAAGGAEGKRREGRATAPIQNQLQEPAMATEETALH